MLTRKTKAIIHHNLIKILLENTKTDAEFYEAVLYVSELMDIELKICDRVLEHKQKLRKTKTKIL